MADTADTRQAPAGIEAARLHVRRASYCAVCDRFVEPVGGACPQGHPAEALFGSVVLGADDPLPKLPRFNVVAFALPPVWGPAHGQWVGVIFLPIWLFADSILSTASNGAAAMTGAVVAALGTFGAQLFWALKANGLAYRAVAGEMSPERFVARQRVWAYVCVPAGLLLLAWALYYRFVLAA